MSFQRSGSCYLFRLVMIALLLLAGGMNVHAASPSPDVRDDKTSGAMASRRSIRFEGEALSFPTGSSVEKLMNKHAVTSRTLSAGVLEKMVLGDPATRLLLRPRITIGDGEDGSFNVMVNQSGPKAGMEMMCLPKIQPDGRIRMDVQLTFYEPQDVIRFADKNRIYRSGDTGSQVLGPIKIGGRNTYFLIKLKIVPY